MATYIDIHILQTVPPSNLNRDDTGSPKSALYGGVRRSRVSSQAWKRATRAEFNSHLADSELGERTKRVVERVAEAITAQRNDLHDRANDLAQDVLRLAGLKIAKPKKKKTAEEDSREEALTEYLIFVSRAQIQALAELAIASLDGKASKADAKKALQDDKSIDIALFGRMIADAPDLNVDACCQVAHAFSVHAATTEFDYFTAVDDHAPEDNAGAGMIGTVEFVSSTMYRYATVNADELANSLGSVDAAARAAEAFLKAFAVSMPTGKLNTFANRTRADLVLVQIRQDQPVNLAEAFEDAITETRGRTTEATRRLAHYSAELDSAYGTEPVVTAFLAAGGAATGEAIAALNGLGDKHDLTGLGELVAAQVRDRVSIG